MNEAGQPGERPLGGGPLQVLRGKVWTVAFSPDGGMVAVGGRENAVRLLALPEAGQPDEIAAIVVDGASPKGYVWSAAFAPSGESLLVGDGVGKVLRCAPVRDETAWRCEDVPAARRRGDAIRALAYSRDAAMVAMGTWNGEVSVWDADFAREEKVSLRGTEGPVHSLVFFDACGGQALAVGKGNDLRYSLIPRADAPAESNGCRTRWKASVGDEVYALAFDAGTRRIVAATRGGYVVVVDPLHSDSDQLRNGAPGVTSKSALRGAILADGASTALLAVPAPRTRAQQANLELFRVVRGRFDRGSEPKAIPAGDGEIVRLSASRASRRLATIEKAADGGGIRVAVWQFDEGFASLRLLKSLTASDFDGKAPMRIALSPDGQQIAVAFFGTDRVLWSRLEAGTAPRWIDAGLVVKEIAFSFDGRHFAAGGGPTEPAGEAADFDRVQVWDAGRGGPPAKIGAAPWRVDASAGKVFELAFAADERDGAQLLVGTARSIERWTVPEGLRLEPLRVGPRAVFRIAFSPERSLVGAADAGNTVWVWDTSSWLGTRLTPDDESAETPGLLAFGGAGRWIANGARGLQVWDLDLESLKQKVCRLLPRPAEGNAGTDRPPSRPDAPCAAN